MERYSETDFAQVIIAIIQVVIAASQLLLSGYTIYFLKQAFEQGNKNIALANKNVQLQITALRNTYRPHLRLVPYPGPLNINDEDDIERWQTFVIEISNKDAIDLLITWTASEYIQFYNDLAWPTNDNKIYFDRVAVGKKVTFFYTLLGIEDTENFDDLPPEKLYIDIAITYNDEMGYAYGQKIETSAGAPTYKLRNPIYL